MSQRAVLNVCRSLKAQCELYPTRDVALALDPYSGLAFAWWCIIGVFAGHHSFLLPPPELEANPAIWFSTLSQHKGLILLSIFISPLYPFLLLLLLLLFLFLLLLLLLALSLYHHLLAYNGHIFSFSSSRYILLIRCDGIVYAWIAQFYRDAQGPLISLLDSLQVFLFVTFILYLSKRLVLQYSVCANMDSSRKRKYLSPR